MTGIRTGSVPQNIDGPSLVAAASGLMLLPQNASRHVRLHRLAALGMALNDNGASPASPSAVRSILKREDIGGVHISMQEDPYSEVLIQSISFIGGPYLVSPGSGEHTVADLENLIDAAFRDRWMPDGMRAPARQLIQGLLTISDTVLKRAGLARGTAPDRPSRPSVDVPSAARLKELTEATFISNDELDAHGAWLRMVVDTLAQDPGDLVDPCGSDITDDRLHIKPFLRLAGGYRVALPLDLLITIRFHILRFARQEGQLKELGQRLRETAFRRFMRLLPVDSSPVLLEQNDTISRYLLKIDTKRDLHAIVATDPLVDWEPELWGSRDTGPVLAQLSNLVSPIARRTYSSAEQLLHLVIVDSPGRGGFWGIPNVDGSDPMLIVRTEDLEIILHQEPDGLLGLLLFAEAIERRTGHSMSTDILDEYCSYVDHGKSFYFSDDEPPSFVVFQTGDALYPRQKYYAETDRHGVIPPVPNPPILQARRRYRQEAPEIFLIAPYSSYLGYVVELKDHDVFVTLDLEGSEPSSVTLDLLECVAYWVRECASHVGVRASVAPTELVLSIEPRLWTELGDLSTADPAVKATPTESGYTLEFTQTFVALLGEATNAAERELVTALLSSNLFGVDGNELPSALDKVAPTGSKRMILAFDQNTSPDMLAKSLPRPSTGHDQVTAQLLDELGAWLRSPEGGSFSTGKLLGEDRVRVLNAAVRHLFGCLAAETAAYDQRILLDFLIAQNESLVHDAKFKAIMLESRLACFGEQSWTVTELVRHRNESTTAQRANRFLIEYVAAQPPIGASKIELLDYYRILSIATEIIQRGTTSDFLHYGLADFEVSILASGRLGVSRDEPVTSAMERYAANSGTRSVQSAISKAMEPDEDDFDVTNFIARSENAVRAEFGFTLTDLRQVSSGLLGLASPDRVTRIDRSVVVAEISAQVGMSEAVVSSVLRGITLSERSSFAEIGRDALPWRFNRDMSYVRRPLVLQGAELVFGFRSIYGVGPYWLDNILSGRLQGRSRTAEMRQCISEARGQINDAFARSVAAKLQRLGLATRMSVKKVGKRRIADSEGKDIGDIDVLAVHFESRSIIAVEAKDFEIARTPAEIAGELEKLFLGKKSKKSTVELHGRRIDWLREHLNEVISSFGSDGDISSWQVTGAVVTSEPLITPLVSSSKFPVISFDDLTLDTLKLKRRRDRSSSRKKRKRKKRKRR